MKKVMERTFRRMNANRNNGKKALKGFTLVEIIVVLVILAILAAAMIPALTGYIDKAKEKTAIAEARSVVTAAQTIASEKYAMNGLKSDENTDGLDATYIQTTKWKDVLTLADISFEEDSTSPISKVEFEPKKAKISNLVYVTSDGSYEVTYSGGQFTIVTKS